MNRSLRTAAAGSIITLIAAQPATPDADRLFEERQYEAALSQYDRLALTTLDPGLIAFNRGVTLLKLNRFSEAERAFRQSLDDAAIPKDRQARGLYNLGISLLRQADEKDVIRLKAALECFDKAGDEAADDAELKADAEYNRGIAEALHAAAKAKAPPPPEPERNSAVPPPEPPEKQPTPKGDNAPKAGGEGDRSNAQPGKGDAQPSGKKPLPGAGSLPVLIDAAEPQRLSAAEARELLEKANARLRGERRRVREGAAETDKPRPHNW